MSLSTILFVTSGISLCLFWWISQLSNSSSFIKSPVKNIRKIIMLVIFVEKKKQKKTNNYLHKYEEFVFQKRWVAEMWVHHTLGLLLGHRSWQRQYHSDHIHRQYFPILQELFDFSFDFYRLFNAQQNKIFY